ncbi:Integral membrane protein TerC family protein [Anatilimnocola aggregata]|uniref:Integral membrane protein TerC family protein n=2 Tax=Anatilimnocola aggregata TaxID=2528021 RepID=A0A517Y6A4_9BACT|nr:Integral membrane protein TerC family protein [Anatilimnocola aggregata]
MVTDAIALLALVAMEIVLGIDNIVFISVVTARLPESQQRQARNIGLALAMIMRIGLLLTITWIMQLTQPAFHWTDLHIPIEWLPGEHHEEINNVTWKDLILLAGGLFLIRSSVLEIHHKVEGVHDEHNEAKRASFGSVIGQIILLDVIFSLDSVITAVGMVKSIWVMITAVMIAVIVMMVFAGHVARFVERHPTVKMLALSFLLLIGVMLLAEGVGTHIDKGYIYFAMAFSLGVEALNLRASSKAARVRAAEAAAKAGKEQQPKN